MPNNSKLLSEHWPSLSELRTLIEMTPHHLNPSQLDEMAIPSYLHFNPMIRRLMKQRYETIASLLRFSNSQTSLEYGCGIGLFLPYLSAHSQTTYAIERFDIFAKALCKKKLLDISFIDNLEEINPESVDLIVAADVLEHDPDPKSTIQILKSKLRTNGQFLICGPTESMIYKFGRFLAGFSKKQHFHFFNINELTEIASEVGFKKEVVVKIPSRLFPVFFKIISFRL